MDQTQFIDMGPLSRDIVINIVAWGVKKALYQFVCLVDSDMDQKVVPST